MRHGREVSREARGAAEQGEDGVMQGGLGGGGRWLRFLSDTRGTSLVEASIAAFVVLFFFIPTVELGRAYMQQSALDHGTQMAARWWSFNARGDEPTRLAVEAIVRREVARSPGAPAVPSVRVDICNGNIPDTCIPLDDRGGRGVAFQTPFRIEATLQFAATGRLPFFTALLPSQLKAATSLAVERYPS